LFYFFLINFNKQERLIVYIDNMSTGAVFKLIANEGKADKMILATKLLEQRLKDVRCAREKRIQEEMHSKNKTIDDPIPTLADIEQTHVLFVNAHFKPFVTMAYEYNKVRPQSGTVVLNSSVTFSIPQFGDFFHDMVCYVKFAAYNWSVLTTPTSTAAAVFPYNTTTTITYSGANNLPVNGDTFTTTYYNLVDSFGHQLVAGCATGGTHSTASYRNFAMYCEYPGTKLFKKVKFDVNGNPLDEYSENVALMLDKFVDIPAKRIGRDRLLGQQIPVKSLQGGFTGTITDEDVANTPAGVINLEHGLYDGLLTSYGQLSDLKTLNATATVANQVDYFRKVFDVEKGPQTPKPVQPSLEIWNKLRFWFNDDVRLAIPSVSIPYGQRFITIDLARGEDLIFEYSNLYREKIEETLSVCLRIDEDEADPETYTHVFISRAKSYTSLASASTGINLDQALRIEKMELYINNIFVNPEIHDIYLKRVGFSLIRVYREHTIFSNVESSDEKLLSQLKWPIEYLMCGLRPTFNTDTSANGEVWRDWHRLTRSIKAVGSDSHVAEFSRATAISAQSLAASTLTNPLPDNADLVAGRVNYGSKSIIAPIAPEYYYIPFPTISTLSLTAHGIAVYDGFGEMFHSAYQPYHYGEHSLSTPEDIGALFVNFSLFPRMYQPSGHLNFSRARETYLKWTSAYVSSNTPVNLITVGVAINFLLIATGSAMLRYST
jgi:hypothetical protein